MHLVLRVFIAALLFTSIACGGETNKKPEVNKEKHDSVDQEAQDLLDEMDETMSNDEAATEKDAAPTTSADSLTDK